MCTSTSLTINFRTTRKTSRKRKLPLKELISHRPRNLKKKLCPLCHKNNWFIPQAVRVSRDGCMRKVCSALSCALSISKRFPHALQTFRLHASHTLRSLGKNQNVKYIHKYDIKQKMFFLPGEQSITCLKTRQSAVSVRTVFLP